MRASVHANNADHQRHFAGLIKQGLERHGVTVEAAAFDTPHKSVDFAVVWGGRQQRVMSFGRPVLVMERGHVGCDVMFYRSSFDAMALPWVSLGWDGINGRGRYPECQDAGERWGANFDGLMQPWRCGATGYALLIGQIAGDSAVKHIAFREWAQDAANILHELGHRVCYRPHPISAIRGDFWRPRGTQMTPKGAPLAEDLDGSALVVTYNSGAAVHSVLAGVPTVAQDPGSMAWDVASYGISDHIRMPEREPWAHRLAWCQWTPTEIERGDFWEVLDGCRR